LAQIRETNAIIQVVRCFPNPEIVHIEGNINPLRDIETVNTELMLKDLETVAKRIEKIIGEAKSGQKEAIKELEILNRIKAELEKGNPLVTVFEKEFLEDLLIKSLNLLTAKKQIYLFNGNEKDLPQTVITKVQAVKGDYVIANLENNPDLSILIKKAYEILDLISFFTIVGEQEARAWPAKRGTKVIEAAGMIHSDFEQKFIKAEVINWQKLLEAENWANARHKGWVKLEGKDYEVQDGDVIIIKHG